MFTGLADLGARGNPASREFWRKDHCVTAYHCDDHWQEHEERSTPSEHPATFRVRRNFEEFLRLPPAAFEEASRAWFQEDFAIVLEDLNAMPNETIFVEGVTLEPEFVLEVADPQQVLFMIASEEFQRKHYLKRDMQRTVFQGLPDPEGSFEAFMGNLAVQTRSLCKRAEDFGLKVIITDESSTLSGSLNLVKEHFDL